jgi:phosphate transport system permease protein
MALQLRSDDSPAAVTPTPATPRRGGSARIRPRSFHRGDIVVLGGAAASSFALVWLVYTEVLGLQGVFGFAAWWYASFLVTYGLAVRELRGWLLAKDAVMTVVIASASLAMLVPLLMIISYVLYQGVHLIAIHFFVSSAASCGPLDPTSCGGVGHAIIGTLEQVGLAVVIAVPLAVLCAVFLNEIRGPMQRPVQLVIDAMSGVPSIVAGLFILAVWVIGLHRGYSGFAGSLGLSILMLPTVTRTSLEVLRPVPDGLREGALALGASEWRTVWSVVLPTARSGLITAVILGVARSVGETAPLIVTVFGSSDFNFNPFSGPQSALPLYVYQYIRFNPKTSSPELAWGGAVVLTFLVLALFTAARVAGVVLSVESRERRAAKRSRRRAAIALGDNA